jgi:hypothetical protein
LAVPKASGDSRVGPEVLASERAVMVKGTNRGSRGGTASSVIRNAVSSRTIRISASMVATFLVQGQSNTRQCYNAVIFGFSL